MTTDQKVDEVLGIVQGHSAQFQKQSSQIEGLFQLILEERKLNGEKFDEVLKIVREQGDRHDLRFAQVDARLDQIDARFIQVEDRLEAKIDKVFDSLSQDIQVFAEDLHHVKRRVIRLEKKLVS